MAGYKETPRQKMIGMMYLVLTAMLALNVSKEILNAFTIVDEAVVETNENFRGKNNTLYSDFKKQHSINPAKVGPYYDKAKQVEQKTQEVIEAIRKAQNKVIDYTEFGVSYEEIKNNYKPVSRIYEDVKTEEEVEVDQPYQVPVEAFKNKSNYDKPSLVMCGTSEKGTDGEANKLKVLFKEYEDEMMSLLNPEDTVGLEIGINTSDRYNPHAGVKQTWEKYTFTGTVLSASVLLLNKYIADIQNIESEVVSTLYSYIKADDLPFDEIDKKVVPTSNIVMQGQEYGSQIFVAAYSSTDTPVVLIKEGVDSVPLTLSENDEGVIKVDSISNGIGFYQKTASSTGEYKYAGVIKVKDAKGEYKAYNFSKSYQVIKPSATVSATKMNVVYRGLENPISISASGYTSNQVSVSTSGGGSLSRKGGSNYVFKPTPGGSTKEVIFRISATDAKGNRASLGSQKFRIKDLPSPIIRLGRYSEGVVDPAAIVTSPYLFAELEDFLFEGVKFSVTQFDLYISHPSAGIIFDERVRGRTLPNKAVREIRKARRGTMINISGVRVTGPNGAESAASLTLKTK